MDKSNPYTDDPLASLIFNSNSISEYESSSLYSEDDEIDHEMYKEIKNHELRMSIAYQFENLTTQNLSPTADQIAKFLPMDKKITLFSNYVNENTFDFLQLCAGMIHADGSAYDIEIKFSYNLISKMFKEFGDVASLNEFEEIVKGHNQDKLKEAITNIKTKTDSQNLHLITEPILTSLIVVGFSDLRIKDEEKEYLIEISKAFGADEALVDILMQYLDIFTEKL